jgi:MFS family permease
MKKNRLITILNNRNFLKIWLSQVFSLVSAATLTFVLIGKIFSLTSSTFAVGIYLFFYYLPTAILGPFVGVFIDNWSKKSILTYSNLIQSVLILFFIFVKQRFWMFYPLGFVYSLGDEFYNPTVAVGIPSLVKKEDLTAANTLFFFTTQTSIIAGSLVGGLMLKLFPRFVFIIISIFLILAALLCLAIPSKAVDQPKKVKESFPKLALNLFWKNTKEGYSFIKNEPLIFFPILLLAGLQSLVGMGIILLPSLTKMIHLEFADSSFLIIIPACVGAITGSWLLGKRNYRVRKNNFVIRGLYIFGASILFLPLVSLLVKSPTLLSLLLGTSLGLGYVFIYIPLQTLIQEHTPFNVRGRVFGTLSTLATLAAAVPLFVTTGLADIIGTRYVLMIVGAGLLIFTYFIQRRKEFIINFNYYTKKND